jgi:predicted DNA-binding transcriptional regulator AlpA
MSLLTQAYLLDKYGPRLNIEQLAEVLGMAKGTIYNQVSAQTFPVPTYVDAKQRWSDYRDVAAYLDQCRATSTRA